MVFNNEKTMARFQNLRGSEEEELEGRTRKYIVPKICWGNFKTNTGEGRPDFEFTSSEILGDFEMYTRQNGLSDFFLGLRIENFGKFREFQYDSSIFSTNLRSDFSEIFEISPLTQATYRMYEHDSVIHE